MKILIVDLKHCITGEYSLLTKYHNNGSSATLLHKTCGTKFQVSRLTRFFNESNDCPCPKCRNVHATNMSVEDRRKLFESKYPEYEIIESSTSKKPATIRCKKCGNIFTISSFGSAFLKNRFTGCHVCNKSKRGQHQQIANYLSILLNEASDGSDYEWQEPYKGRNNIKHRIKHLKCGHEYEVRPYDFKTGYRCPFCSRKRSHIETAFADTLKSEIGTSLMIIESDRSAINPYELDIFFPTKKIAIEFNGLFWHSEPHKDKSYHEKKRILCEKKGIQLIQIYEDEWVNHKDIVLSKIKSVLGIRKGNIVYARKCDCRKITDPHEYMDFLNENHIQGAVTLSLAYGLYYNNKLVAMGGFNKLRGSMNTNNIANAYDMIRYATKIDTAVIGGCGKIISEFVKAENCKYMKTLADLRFSKSSGNMYEKLGFTKACYVRPRYFYTDGKTRYSRFSYKKSEIQKKFPEIYDGDLTEFQMMDKTGLRRIWDAGKITYEKYF